MVGIEPTTRALRMRCSTTELHRRRFFGVNVIARAARRVKRLNRGALPRLRGRSNQENLVVHTQNLSAPYVVTPGSSHSRARAADTPIRLSHHQPCSQRPRKRGSAPRRGSNPAREDVCR
jgi:hypothetical protein